MLKRDENDMKDEIVKGVRELLAQLAKYPWFECLVKTLPAVDINDPDFQDEVIRKTMDKHINVYLSHSYDQVENETEMFRSLTKEEIISFIRLFRYNKW